MAQFNFDDSFGYLINRTAKRLKFELHSAFKANGYNITAEQWAVLNRLWEKDGISQIELAEKTYKNKPTITRMIDVLERKGFVLRESDKYDRRMFKIYLTKEGRALEEKLVPIAKQVLERGGRNLSREDIDYLKKILNTVFDNFN
ncbi:MarR family winged helix-turn-helix transcriptional regulator [Chloroflexota bacterium]